MTQAYTVVLCQTPAGILLINRAKPPYRGRWNGLGGKVEPGESPAAGAVREVQEESGAVIQPRTLFARGLVHWFEDDQWRGDLYLFAAQAAAVATPQATREGIVAAWSREWLQAPDNLGLTPDLPALLPYFFGSEAPELTSRFAGNRFIGLTLAAAHHD